MARDRTGHTRPTGFPAALALIGMHDVRDYKVAPGGGERLNTASPFNIKTRSMTLESFSRDDMAALYQQHTGDTGQVFLPTAIDYAFYLTQGQPGWSMTWQRPPSKRCSTTNRDPSPWRTLKQPKKS